MHRVPLQTLQKCGESLERMFGSHLKEISDAHHSHSSLEPPPSLPPTAKLPEFSRSQSLLEFKMIPSPPPTCNNLLETIQAKPLPPERLPPAKRQCNRGQRGDIRCVLESNRIPSLKFISHSGDSSPITQDVP